MSDYPKTQSATKSPETDLLAVLGEDRLRCSALHFLSVLSSAASVWITRASSTDGSSMSEDGSNVAHDLSMASIEQGTALSRLWGAIALSATFRSLTNGTSCTEADDSAYDEVQQTSPLRKVRRCRPAASLFTGVYLLGPSSPPTSCNTGSCRRPRTMMIECRRSGSWNCYCVKQGRRVVSGAQWS